MKLLAVFQEGVYRHSCGGVYDSEERAIAAADRIAVADVDDYHTYDVVPFTLNHDDEGSAIYSVNRQQALAKLGPHDAECSEPSKDWRRSHSLCSRGTAGCDRDTCATAVLPDGGSDA
jgi:hypothetical protein